MNWQATQTPEKPETQEPLIELKNVSLSFGPKRILNGVHLKVYRNEMVAILGPSGSGKSTLLKIVAGLLEVDEGEVNIRSDKIGLSFQYGALFSSMSVEDNLWLVLSRSTNLSDAEIERRIDEALTLVGLEEEKKKFPDALSGGMIKRVDIARALAIHPDIMLYDEPSAALDPVLAGKLEKDLRDINKKLKIASLVVTHELPTVKNLADRVILLYEGKFVYEGSTEDFFSTEEPHAKQFRTRQEYGPIEV